MSKAPHDPGRFDAIDFRNALGAFATGITIVTTLTADGKRLALTVNSFNSVSLDPPLVLWSLASSAASLAAFRTVPYFAVNILAEGQEAVAQHFARRGDDKFIGCGVEVSQGLGGIPLLEGVSARFECRSEHQAEGGDHIVFFGRVERYHHWDRPPLVFHRGRYTKLHSLTG